MNLKETNNLTINLKERKKSNIKSKKENKCIKQI